MSSTSEATDRESLLVELVDEQGLATGICPVAEAHTAPGLLHRAFSVLLFDESGRVLLQQRAAVKTRFPLQWANTCCGHPAPGQSVVDAAAVRLAEELGIRTPVREIGTFQYRAADATTGRVEFEFDHVLIGRFDGMPPRPDPGEVADYAWVRPEALAEALDARPDIYTPWLGGVLTVVGRSN
ncbi:isopentenyl-diphosphate Delta-isomerase [Nocardia sp. NPDC051570]|uniref:isopentenyl-diphosphate Delta-isomerase n=1 Tax=Nocardia sp. NPDC051570 TaxID=3364324 RepID=UPI0037AECE37